MKPPLVSVVIPVRNEGAWIRRCLASVLAQDYPADRMEIIVVDGMSDDGSVAVLEELTRSEPLLKVYDNPGRIVPTGLNIALRRARGEVIARVDAHTDLDPSYLSTSVKLLLDSGAENVGGPMRCKGGGRIGDAIALAMASRFGVGSYFHYAERAAECDTVYMGTWPRRVFERVGLFDEELVRNQDDELNYRIRKAGGRVLVFPEIRSSYQNRQSLGALARQFFEYGVWKVRVLQKHPRQMSVRHFLPPLFDLTVLGAALAALVWPAAGLLSISAVTAYAVFIAGVALVEGRGVVGRVLLFSSLAVMHHAWALGFLWGLLRFARRWFARAGEVPRLDSEAVGTGS
ncbi:MAG: glycosyltransferase family 2 protein [Candidatus Binatia bacterium]